MSTPLVQYGKDHWSLLAYVETLCVDSYIEAHCADGRHSVGAINRTKMRCNPDKHPLLTGVLIGGWKSEYATRLAGFFLFADRADADKAVAAGFQLAGHDDWDCLDDLEEEGLIEIFSQTNGYVRITDKGLDMTAKLRAHKANGGYFSNFVVEPARSHSLSI